MFVAIGKATLDVLGVVPRFPEKNTKTRFSEVSMDGGGPAATAACAAAKLGARARFVGKIGDDDFGRAILRGFDAHGVDASFVVVEKAKTSPFSLVAIDASDASRTIFHSTGDLDLVADDVDWRCLDGARVVLVDGHHPHAQREAVLRARALGALLLLDGGSRKDGMDDLVAASDVVVASARLAEELLPAGDDEARLRALLAAAPRARAVVVTLGERGAIGLSRGGAIVRRPAFAVDAVDTTGAGDVYHGAFAVGLLDGAPLEACMELGAAAAALKCRALGGRAALPTRGEVLALQNRATMR